MVDILYKMFACIVYFLISLLFCRLFAELVCVLFDLRLDKFFKKIKDKLTQNNDAYKDFVRTTNSYGRVVELPFSVVQPLLRDDSPMIVVAQNDRLAIKDENCRNNNIYIKLSKKDYNEYIKFLEQKKVNKRNLKKTEDTLAATELINKELKRINEEAIKSIIDETDNIKKIVETCEYLNFEEPEEDLHKEFREIMSSYKKSAQFVSNDGTVYDFEEPSKFDWELFDDIWNGHTAILMTDEVDRVLFSRWYFDYVIASLTSQKDVSIPICAHYSRYRGIWEIDDVITRLGTNIQLVHISDVMYKCPDFANKFKKRINTQGGPL